MARPNVSVIVTNGGIGRVETTPDGVVGMVMNGVATSNLNLGEAKQIFSLKELEALGIDSDYDANNGIGVYEIVKSFYEEAGDGSELWLMLVSNAVAQTQICSVTNNYAKGLLLAANGRIKVLGVKRFPDAAYVPTIVTGLDSDVFTAIANAQILANDMANKFMPVRIMLDGYAYNNNAVALKDLRTDNKNRVGVLIAAMSVINWGNAIGLLLGRIARIPVQRNIGRKIDGSIGDTYDLYIGANKVSDGESTAVSDKGYITLRTHPRTSGNFFVDDPMATSISDDYSSLVHGRVIDKAITIAYDTYSQLLLDNIELNTAGKIAIGQAKSFETVIESNINVGMAGEINGVKAYVDPDQNVLQTGKLMIDLRIQPLGILREIVVNLGLSKSI